MEDLFDVFIGLDPGVVGGISILEQYAKYSIIINRVPVKNIVVNNKKKKTYDLDEFYNILSKFSGKKVLFIQEKVASRPGEGSVSSFNFGKSCGSTLGMAIAFGFKVIEVSPSTWKKDFSQLNNANINGMKEETKILRALAKTLKDKDLKNENKKQIEKLNRQIKIEAKSQARSLASSLYPEFSDFFKQKNSDGMAESLLIAIYGRNNQNELVQKC